jgi:hypothetical protein
VSAPGDSLLLAQAKAKAKAKAKANPPWPPFFNGGESALGIRGFVDFNACSKSNGASYIERFNRYGQSARQSAHFEKGGWRPRICLMALV